MLNVAVESDQVITLFEPVETEPVENVEASTSGGEPFSSEALIEESKDVQFSESPSESNSSSTETKSESTLETAGKPQENGFNGNSRKESNGNKSLEGLDQSENLMEEVVPDLEDIDGAVIDAGGELGQEVDVPELLSPENAQIGFDGLGGLPEQYAKAKVVALAESGEGAIIYLR